jgi:hypothetical protein
MIDQTRVAGRAAREASGERSPVVQGLQRRCTARRSGSKWWQWLYRTSMQEWILATTAYGSDLVDMCIHVDKRDSVRKAYQRGDHG